MKSWRIGGAALVCWLAFGCGGGDLLAAGYRMPISFPGYSNRTETLTDFPVLIVLSNGCDSAGMFDYEQFLSAEGWDLRFRDSADTVNLDYEIEQWNPDGVSLVWVRVPELPGDGAGAILAKWGDVSNSERLPCTTNGAVWDAHYRLVWHLKESGNGTLNEFRDSTANLKHGRGGNGAASQTPAQTDGQVGSGNLFDATDDFIYITGGLAVPIGSGLTFETWLKPTAWVGSNPGGWRDGTTSSGSNFNIFQAATGRPWIRWNGTDILKPASGYAVPLGAWTHVAYTVASGSSASFLADGQRRHGLTHTRTTPAFSIYNVGYQSSLGERINGTYDEIRFSTTVRSTNWIWCTWLNMASNAVFCAYDAVATTAGEPVIANVGAFDVQGTAANMVGDLRDGSLPATVTCFWGTEDGGNNPALWQTNNSWSVGALGLLTNVVAGGMLPGTRYYFRFHATNALNYFWAPGKVTFSTLGAPRVENLAAGAVGQTNAVLRGSLRGGNPEPEVWIHWGTSDGETNTAAWNMPELSLGSPGLVDFQEAVGGLSANQIYWYRCYASNAFDGGSANWAPSSTNFTTALPTLSIAAAAVAEGPPASTADMIFALTLSAPSAAAVDVVYATADGTATAASGDYQAASGTLSIPAGVTSTQILVKVNGNDVFEADKNFVVNLSNVAGATLASTQATGTIINDDFTFYVRGDGAGSDANAGSGWSDAWATLQKALSGVPTSPIYRSSIPASVPRRINVQASSGGQFYDVAARSTGVALDLDFQGGWENVDAAPAQTGTSQIRDADATLDEAGISITGAGHGGWRRVVVHRFCFTNVTRAVQVVTASGSDSADIFLIVSNTTVRAQADGLYIDYPKGYDFNGVSGYGGYGQIRACNVDILAGLGGSGAAVFSEAHWGGSAISAHGSDPLTGEPMVSRLSAPNGMGVYMRAVTLDRPAPATFERTVIHDCGDAAIVLSASRPGYNSAPGSNRVQAVVLHCTLADNGGDGLKMASVVAGSWAHVTNSITAGNDGGAINLMGSGFTCAEGYNVFHDDALMVNGAPQSPAATSSTGNPLFMASGAKPVPWYALGAKASPAWESATDGTHRGAWQGSLEPRGTILLVR